MIPSDVTFVGLGAMGLPMAARLVQGGLAVTGVDPFPAALAAAQAAGIAPADSIADAPPARVVVIMVATPAQLDEVVELAPPAAIDGATWIITSTVGPDAMAAAAARLAGLGALVVDAPVTGGVRRAITGELTLFASGSPEALDAARPVLEHLGDARVVGSQPGDGQSVKVVNQHLCAVHIAVAAEALALARGLGLDPERVLDLVEDGAAASWMLPDRGPRMLEDDPAVMSQVGIFVKDTGLVAAAAAKAGADTPLLDAARARFLAAAEAGDERRDDSRVIGTYPTW